MSRGAIRLRQFPIGITTERQCHKTMAQENSDVVQQSMNCHFNTSPSYASMTEIPLEPPCRGLRGKVALVTGAGCVGDGVGNGRAISIMLTDEGCNVICLDRDLSWARKTAEIANSKPGRGEALPTQGDVTSSDDCKAAVQLALERFGRLDIVVNNVGIAGPPGTAVEVDLVQWAQGLETNVSSMVAMAKHAVPAMAKNEGEVKGSIINMGSVAGLKGGTPHLLYPTSKGAVVNMTRAMAAHHAESGIRVNCVCPGVCRCLPYIIHSEAEMISFADTDAHRCCTRQ